MKKILSIVFLVIPLLFFTYACGEETQAKVPPVVQNVVEKTKSTEVITEEEKPVAESTEVTTEEEKPVAESTEVTTEEEVVEKPVAMADYHKGEKVFKANCAGCHIGGGNMVMANKTLKKEALEKYGMYSEEAIVYQVTNGKNAMPAFKGRLTEEQIEEVAKYVLAQADKGWSK